MYQYKFVFAQLIAFLDRNHFNYLVHKYTGDKYAKRFDEEQCCEFMFLTNAMELTVGLPTSTRTIGR